MTNVPRTRKRRSTKTSDEDILRLNSVGLSLSTIARELNCHPTTITQRLKALGVPAADTRRAFMEEVFLGLTAEQQEWFVEEVSGTNLKDYMRKLIINEFNSMPLPPPQMEKPWNQEEESPNEHSE